MKVYLNGLSYGYSGVGRYYEFLLQTLISRGITVYTDVEKKFVGDFKEKYLSPLIKLISTEETRIDIPDKCPVKGMDLYIYPYPSLPKHLPHPCIVTIHDMIPFEDYWEGLPKEKENYIASVIKAVKEADKIVTISKTSEKEILERFPEAKRKITVIHDCFEPKLAKLAQKQDKPLIKDDYFLYVGTRMPNKNLLKALEAFQKVKNKEVKFVIAGPKFNNACDVVDQCITELGLVDKVIIKPNPTDEELANFYKYARFLFMPSLQEGFGLPPMEALSIGTPVLISDIPIFHELYHGVAEFVDPNNVEDMAEKLNNWCKEGVRPQINTQRVLQLLSKFTPDKIASKYMNLFADLIEEQDISPKRI